MKLTDALARTVELPNGVADRVFFDDAVSNFGVRVRTSGERSWHVQYYAGRVRRMSLGPISAMPCNKARNVAIDLLAKVRLGQDPAADKAKARTQAADTIGAVLPDYLRHKQAGSRPHTMTEIRRHLEQQAKPLHARLIADIDQRTAAQFLARFQDRPAARNRLRSSLVAFFTWLKKNGYAEKNPFQDTVKETEQPRDRIPSLPELAEIWKAVGDCDLRYAQAGGYGDIIKLLMLTGCRRDEIGSLRWSEIQNDMIVIPGSRTKNHRELEIMLTPAMRKVLDTLPKRTNPDGTPRDLIFGVVSNSISTRFGGGFSGYGKKKAALDAAINANRKQPMEPWTPHDFRRSMSTYMNEFRVLPHIVEFCLNHIGVKAGVAGVYNQARYREDKAAAWALWNEALMDVIEGRKGKVVALRRR